MVGIRSMLGPSASLTHPSARPKRAVADEGSAESKRNQGHVIGDKPALHAENWLPSGAWNPSGRRSSTSHQDTASQEPELKRWAEPNVTGRLKVRRGARTTIIGLETMAFMTHWNFSSGGQGWEAGLRQIAREKERQPADFVRAGDQRRSPRILGLDASTHPGWQQGVTWPACRGWHRTSGSMLPKRIIGGGAYVSVSSILRAFHMNVLRGKAVRP
jgi:hypothetical protein